VAPIFLIVGIFTRLARHGRFHQHGLRGFSRRGRIPSASIRAAAIGASSWRRCFAFGGAAIYCLGSGKVRALTRQREVGLGMVTCPLEGTEVIAARLVLQPWTRRRPTITEQLIQLRTMCRVPRSSVRARRHIREELANSVSHGSDSSSRSSRALALRSALRDGEPRRIIACAYLRRHHSSSCTPPRWSTTDSRAGEPSSSAASSITAPFFCSSPDLHAVHDGCPVGSMGWTLLAFVWTFAWSVWC
jgi:hypothetical protein